VWPEDELTNREQLFEESETNCPDTTCSSLPDSGEADVDQARK
jgi:hypothetical protein